MTDHCHLPAPRARLAPLGIFLVLASIAAAPPSEKTDESPSSWLPILRRQAADYEIVPRDESASKSKPTPLPDPILRWTQPVRGGDDGAVFLWVADGRPAVVGTVFTYRVSGSPRAFQHEVHSLMASPLEATWRGRQVWRTSAPGLTFKAVPEAPVPSTSASARLRQMQATARDFAFENVHEKSGRNALRLMPKPLHRYGAAGAPALDGAMFCFAHGTDPEAFLFLEARPKGDATEWQYAMARFSDLALRAKYKGRDIWSVPPGQWERRDGIHAYFVAEQVDADTPDEYRKAAEATPSKP